MKREATELGVVRKKRGIITIHATVPKTKLKIDLRGEIRI